MSVTKTIGIIAFAVLPVLTVWAVSDQSAAGSDGPQLEWLKRLAGTWVRVDEEGHATEEVVSVYRETAGGSAIIETLFPGTEHEMVTVYYRDGRDLVLTHYCVMGNQPRMKAAADSTRDKIAFKCAGGSNMKSENDHHMHQATVTITDDNHIHAEWVSQENGVVNHTVSFSLMRKS
jgi:hypothetical protein